MTAATVSARLGRRTLVLAGDVPGGLLLSIEKIEGFPGFPDGVAGYDLCPMTQEQAVAAGAELMMANLQAIDSEDENWRVSTDQGETRARAVILATGSTLKKLDVPGEERLRGKGVSHCATCDAPLLRNRIVAVAGGGDSALQEGLTLAEFASKVILIEQSGALTGQKAYLDRVTANPKIEIRTGCTIDEVTGEQAVTGIRIRDMNGGTTSDLEVGGLFVYIGLAPGSACVKGRVALDAAGAVVTDASMRTELKGLCAAGTVRAGAGGRAASSAGDGSTAAIVLDRYLSDGRWR